MLICLKYLYYLAEVETYIRLYSKYRFELKKENGSAPWRGRI